MRLVALVGVVLAGLVLASCSGPPPGPTITLSNRTDIPIAVHVNSVWVGTYGPGAEAPAPLGVVAGPPYRIDFKSPTGAVLMSWEIAEPLVDPLTESSVARVDLPCGTIEAWEGLAPTQPRPEPVFPPAGPCP